MKLQKRVLIEYLSKTGLYQFAGKPMCWVIVIFMAAAMTGRAELFYPSVVVAVLIAAWLIYTDK